MSPKTQQLIQDRKSAQRQRLAEFLAKKTPEIEETQDADEGDESLGETIADLDLARNDEIFVGIIPMHAQDDDAQNEEPPGLDSEEKNPGAHEGKESGGEMAESGEIEPTEENTDPT
jgi:hypothetical protein